MYLQRAYSKTEYDLCIIQMTIALESLETKTKPNKRYSLIESCIRQQQITTTDVNSGLLILEDAPLVVL